MSTQPTQPPLADFVKAYDVRGVVGEQIDADFVREVGASFARLMRSEGAGSVVIGHDMRDSSPGLSAAFADGVTAQGGDREPGEQQLFVNALTTSVLAPNHIAVLSTLLDNEPAAVNLEGLVVDTDLRWSIVNALATAGAIIGLVTRGVDVENIETTSKTLPGFAQMWAEVVAQ